jgi:hypothetical protein
LGEILKSKERVAALFGAGNDLELMAVVAFGHLAKQPGDGERDSLGKRVFFRK